jgi:hypothetical protein
VLFRASEKVFYHLPDLGLSHGAWAAINDCGELAWLARPLNDGDTVVLVLRRIAPNGDFNHDCRIDAYDFSILENCFTGPDAGPADGLLADCTRADFDDDGDVDETDVSAFLGAAGGPAAPVPDCQAIALCGS